MNQRLILYSVKIPGIIPSFYIFLLASMKRLILTVTASLSIFAIGCNDSNGPLPVNTSVIMPLAVGNQWIGLITDFDNKGNVVSQKFDTLKVYKREFVNGEVWYYMDHFPLSWGMGLYAFTNRRDGLYECDSNLFAQAKLIAKYPAMPRDTFSSTFEGSPNGAFSMYEHVVDTLHQPITVPAGTYSCYVYHFEGYDWNGSDVRRGVLGPEEFYAPGVGLIQNGYCNIDGSFDSFVSPQEIWQLMRADLH